MGSTVNGVKIIGTPDELLWMVAWREVEEVVLTGEQTDLDMLAGDLNRCYARGTAISLMPHMYEEVTGQLPVDHSGLHWVGSIPLHRTGGGLYAVIKRMIDVLVSLFGIAIGWPVMLVVAILVRLSSRGPILYRQTRVGLHDKPFDIIKFRTMGVDAECEGEAIWACRDDPRSTRVGRWLRRTHLDELPQRFLALQGEMSLVGPRPERPEFVRRLKTEIPLYPARSRVRPGITGWAQVRHNYGSSVDDALVKLRFDLYYIKHRSFLLDLMILIQTAAQVLGLRGR